MPLHLRLGRDWLVLPVVISVCWDQWAHRLVRITSLIVLWWLFLVELARLWVLLQAPLEWVKLIPFLNFLQQQVCLKFLYFFCLLYFYGLSQQAFPHQEGVIKDITFD